MKHQCGGGHDAYQTRFYRILRANLTACVRHPAKVVGVKFIAFLQRCSALPNFSNSFFRSLHGRSCWLISKLPEGSSFAATSEDCPIGGEVLDKELIDTNVHEEHAWSIWDLLGHHVVERKTEQLCITPLHWSRSCTVLLA